MSNVENFFYQFWDYEIGGTKVRIGSWQGRVVFVGFPFAEYRKWLANPEMLERRFKGRIEWKREEIMDRCAKVIERYFRGGLSSTSTPFFEIENSCAIKDKGALGIFRIDQEETLPVMLFGTEFQRKVWIGLSAVEYGKNITYSGLATSIGAARSVRAVANAVGANPLSILIPCHRVVAKGGLGGYAWGESLKRRLLEMESI